MWHRVTDKNFSKASLAWRKKPRRWAPKSRQGCKTCKIRRVKCDLARPSCLKCSSTGRACDGYNDATQHQAGEFHHILQTIGSLMIMPMTGSVQAEALCFFQNTSIEHINAYRPSQSWRNTLMYFVQTVPAVRHAALAVASVHRKYLDRDYSIGASRSQYLKDWLSDTPPLLHYNRAIQLLLNQESGQDIGAIAITLLVCYLFVCFDQLAGDDVRAINHLSQGVKLLSHVDRTMLRNKDNYNEAIYSGYSTLISQVRRQIDRLDMQAVQMSVIWDPVSLQKSFTSQCLNSDTVFHSLDEAADHLQILSTQIMRLRWCTEKDQKIFTAEQMQPSLSILHNIVLGQLETWSSLFEKMLQHCSSSEVNSMAVSFPRLQYLIAWILLNTRGSGREMDYDHFLPRFQQSIKLASHVVATQKPYPESRKATFTPECGIIPILYIIGVKCRHPAVRRQAVTLLRQRPIREASWESTIAARVVERIIGIEEGGAGEEGMVQSMEQIPMWRRVEDVSWFNSASGRYAVTINLTYTLCGGEETYSESLMV
ncbi:sugar transporter [Periconia macrospinosa]|uniref:Sugar transporter n=1 Tax=Periconia macrospinosa TaxID=97972 RepID=A0A2V1D1N4_9PLEO|nr:sugar transporter [Periconia macrospinosa]